MLKKQKKRKNLLIGDKNNLNENSPQYPIRVGNYSNKNNLIKMQQIKELFLL